MQVIHTHQVHIPTGGYINFLFFKIYLNIEKQKEMFKKITLFTLAALLSCSTFAQQIKGMGEVFDFDLLAKTPQKIRFQSAASAICPPAFHWKNMHRPQETKGTTAPARPGR